jgi:microsomal dipeptidase-like Zn-dependent dipeptidase
MPTEGNTNNEKSYIADAMAFLDHPAKPLWADSELNALDLAHVTVAPPILTDAKTLLTKVEKSKTTIESQQRLGVVYEESDIGLLKSIRRTAIVMGLQNSPIDGHFDLLYKAGVRVFGLWYQGRNNLGGGFDLPNEPITTAGEAALCELADLGAIVDLSHAGHTCARGAIKYISDKGLPIKIMASHGGCYSVYNSKRNLPDDVLTDIVNMGGIVGVYTLTFGLSADDNTLVPFIRHLEKMVDLCGAENVAIGSDGVYRKASKEELQKQFDALGKLVDSNGAFGTRFPAQPFCTYSPLKMEIIEREILKKNSVKLTENISRIMGMNLRDFFTRSLPS